MVSNMVEGITQTLKQDGIGGLFAGYYVSDTHVSTNIPYPQQQNDLWLLLTN